MIENIKHTDNTERTLSSREREQLIESIINDIMDLTNNQNIIPDYDLFSTSSMM